VTVLERGEPAAEASSAAAGLLAAEAEAPLGTLFDLGLESRDLHLRLAEELKERTGLDVGLRRAGILEVVTEPSSLERSRAAVDLQRSRGLEAELLTAEAVREREPSLALPALGGAYFPRDAQLDPVALARASAQAAARAGVTLRLGVEARRLASDGSRVTGVETQSGTVTTGAVVVCAGAWSSALLPEVSGGVRVGPARGQVASLAALPVPLGSVVFGPSGYLVPRPEGAVWAGSTVEFVGFERGVTAQGLAGILSMAQSAVPSLAGARVLGTWSGFRPWTSDLLPVLGACALDGLYAATGHFRSGILLAPVTAEIVAELVTTGRSSRPLGDYSPARIAPR
jgi:glycine oxidase